MHHNSGAIQINIYLLSSQNIYLHLVSVTDLLCCDWWHTNTSVKWIIIDLSIACRLLSTQLCQNQVWHFAKRPLENKLPENFHYANKKSWRCSWIPSEKWRPFCSSLSVSNIKNVLAKSKCQYNCTHCCVVICFDLLIRYSCVICLPYAPVLFQGHWHWGNHMFADYLMSLGYML